MAEMTEFCDAIEQERRFKILVKAIFREADKNHDNFLQPKEFQNVLNGHFERMGQQVPTNEMFAEIFDCVDLNHDGKLSLDEYEESVRPLLFNMMADNRAWEKSGLN